MADEMWARLGIPIALAFFTQNGDTGETVAFYPSPAGSTECELDLDAWADLVEANPKLSELEPDAEAFIVNRMSDPPQYVIVPIDRCYEMVGAVKMAWEGISGGDGVDTAIAAFFERLSEDAGMTRDERCSRRRRGRGRPRRSIRSRSSRSYRRSPLLGRSSRRSRSRARSPTLRSGRSI